MKLILKSSAFPSGRIELVEEDLPVTVGRSTRADIIIGDSLLSRIHSEIRWLDTSGFEIADLDSTNLTIVNRHDIDNHTLRDGDLILLGDTEIFVQIDRVDGGIHDRTTRELPVIESPSSPEADQSGAE